MDKINEELLTAARNILHAIMDDHGGSDLLPVNEAFDPEHYALVIALHNAVRKAEEIMASGQPPTQETQ